MGNHATNPKNSSNRYYDNNKYDFLENEPTLIINPFLYLGGMYARQNPLVLENLGITHILNMAAEQHLDTVYLENCNINVKHILADDYEMYNIRQHFEEAFQFIEDALSKNGRILIHCAVGISRSPTIVIAYIMYRYGMTYQNAFQYVQNLRPNINPNNSFKLQLQEFEYELMNYTAQQQKQHLVNMPIQNHLPDNYNLPQKNISNFTMNGMNPISVKGSKKNYLNHMNTDKAKPTQKPVNYMDQNMLHQNVFNNPFYIDSAGMYFSQRLYY